MRNRRLHDTLPDDLMRKLKVFGQDIKAARKARRTTQADFAKSLNVGRATVVRMEDGDHTVGFGVVAGAAWLMGLENNLLQAFSPETDPVMQREARLSLPDRVGTPRPDARKPVEDEPETTLDF